MQSIQQCAGHEILRPNHAGRPHQKSSAQASKAETCELGGDDQENAEPIVDGDVVIYLGYDDGIQSVWRSNGHVCHDVDEDMLFDIPRAGVQGEF